MGDQIDPALIAAMVDRLTSFPANGRPANDDTTMALIIAGFIERREITKACRECGTPRLDYSYMKITAGGRLFLAAAKGAGNG